MTRMLRSPFLPTIGRGRASRVCHAPLVYFSFSDVRLSSVPLEAPRPSLGRSVCDSWREVRMVQVRAARVPRSGCHLSLCLTSSLLSPLMSPFFCPSLLFFLGAYETIAHRRSRIRPVAGGGGGGGRGGRGGCVARFCYMI